MIKKAVQPSLINMSPFDKIIGQAMTNKYAILLVFISAVIDKLVLKVKYGIKQIPIRFGITMDKG